MSDLHDMVLALDRQQGLPDALRCKVDPDHGRLQAHGSASALVCGKCGYNVPATLPDKPKRQRG